MSNELLVSGLYDLLLTRAMAARLERRTLEADIAEVDPEDAHAAVAQYVEHLLFDSLSALRGQEARARQQKLVARLLGTLAEELGGEWLEQHALVDPLARLLVVHGDHPRPWTTRPDTPLARSALLTLPRTDPTLASQLAKEFSSADRVDILCSFIKWSGLRLVLDALRELTACASGDGPRLRVISTSYMGATDAKAIEELAKLPNTEVRVSYDTESTRLHAKAYIVYRKSGFGSAYIGSANLSKAALLEGLEWTSKLSQYELPYLWQKVTATFETLWNEPGFEPFGQSDAPRLRRALQKEGGPDGHRIEYFFDLHPYPFQEEILDALAAERANTGKKRQLIVAATGTGKSVIAAFDYKRFAANSRPSLLFIAHREEILRQALSSFRHILRDQNFGEVLAGGATPTEQNHLFCTIQSYNSRGLDSLNPAHYRYIVVDEFHHAPAESYQRLLDHVQPEVLLGLTATPERMDGRDVRDWFGGEATAEVRLPDAIDRLLLCPFQYFGVSDCVDLDGIRWERGGYRRAELESVYTGNDARAGLVLERVCEYLNDVREARGLGFCVSIAHAEFMARYFDERGVPALALSATSPDDIRQAAKNKLVSREVNFIFVVDLYNEGVDIPEVDTVLFLRPTESLTVFLQQLGRGLRKSDEKECLTVLDFIGAHRREFRFAERFRALSMDPTRRLEAEVEADFPHLPAGCHIRLERVAKQRVLDNIKNALQRNRRQLFNQLRQLADHLGRAPSLREALDFTGIELHELLKHGLWSRLQHEAGVAAAFQAPDEETLTKGLRRLSLIDDPVQIRFVREYLTTSPPTPLDETELRRLHMFYRTLWGTSGEIASLERAAERFLQNPSARSDALDILAYRLAHTRVQPLAPALATPAFTLHASYTRDEILAGLGILQVGQTANVWEGVLHLPESKLDVFFVTLHKTEDAYSPTTMYEDYAISDRFFHWQSQSTTSESSPTGQRYIDHEALGYTPLLFVRDYKQFAPGLTAPYFFLGPARYISHEGSRPMSIKWRLDWPMPARIQSWTKSA